MLHRILSKIDAYKTRRRREAILPEENDDVLEEMKRYWTSDRIGQVAQSVQYFAEADHNFYYLAATSASELRKYKKVMDFGAGAGGLTCSLASKYPGMHIYAYDLAYRASEALYNDLIRIEKCPRVTFVKDYVSVLDDVELVFSNLVFSHFSPKALEFYLKLFKERSCDLLISARSDLPQKLKGQLSKRRGTSLYCHNYYRYLFDFGFDVKWVYSMDRIELDKRCIYIYAKS